MGYLSRRLIVLLHIPIIEGKVVSGRRTLFEDGSEPVNDNGTLYGIN